VSNVSYCYIGWVDPESLGERADLRHTANESLGMGGPGGLQGSLSSGEHRRGLAMVAVVGGERSAKCGGPVELGVRVCVLEDQYQFILHHQVMWQTTDDKVLVSMVAQARERYPELVQCSFDKGFYTPANQRDLSELLAHVILPKKGRLSTADKARETSDIFRTARHQHSADKSCINNLEQRGLDRCRYHGKHGFERRVALSVVATNVHRMGLLLQRTEKKKLERAERRTRKKNSLLKRRIRRSEPLDTAKVG
jgi:hypothetical protein